MNKILLMILGMTLVTYIPRLLPFLMVSNEDMPKRLRRFLTLIPYTALGALIIPGVFSTTPDMPAASLVGISFAVIYAWFKGGIIVPVIGSIVATFIMLVVKF